MGMKPPKFKRVQPIDHSSIEVDSGKPQPYARTIKFYNDELPVKEWKVGEEYQVILKIKQTETGIQKHGAMKGKTYAEFDLQEVADYSK